jgi:hypothetical protein
LLLEVRVAELGPAVALRGVEVHLAALDLEFIRLERFRLERARERGLRGLGKERDVELRPF